MGIETNALIFGWNRPAFGRETHAAELFGQTVSYFEKLQKSGKLESFEPCFLEIHGGQFNGFFFVKGTHQNLHWMQTDQDFQDILIRAGLCLEGAGIVPSWRGSAVNDVMARWTKAIPR
jgi:hypothetical protein